MLVLGSKAAPGGKYDTEPVLNVVQRGELCLPTHEESSPPDLCFFENVRSQAKTGRKDGVPLYLDNHLA